MTKTNTLRLNMQTQTWYRISVFCFAISLLLLQAGCPVTDVCTNIGLCCAEDSDCDNSDPCIIRTCNEDGLCTPNRVICANDEVCEEGLCVATCTDDMICDDENLCTNDTCVDGACVNEAVVCDDGNNCTTDSCDPQSGECVATDVSCQPFEMCEAETGLCVGSSCVADEDCPNDDNMCTSVMCVDDACAEMITDCDDEKPCTSDTCDPATGLCTNSEITCLEGEVCDNGLCTGCVECTDDTHCNDDGLFCNGVERCGADGCCFSSGTPCETSKAINCERTEFITLEDVCDENHQACGGNLPGYLTLTTSADTFIGGVDDDTLTAVYTGTSTSTINDGDILDGCDGNDTLSVIMTGELYDVLATIRNIENIIIKNFHTAGATFNAQGIEGVTNFAADSGLFKTSITMIGELAAIGVKNTAKDVTANFVDSVLSGTADTITVNVENSAGEVTAGTTTVAGSAIIVGSTTGSSIATNGGPETITLNSTGTADNLITSIDDNGENDFMTLKITGDQSLRVSTIGDSVTTIDASGLTGTAAMDVTTNNADANTLTVTGGPGIDILRSSAFSSADTFDGGDGADTLIMSGTSTSQTGAFSGGALTNVEFLTLALSGTVTAATVDLNNAQNVGQVKITNTATTLAAIAISNLTANPAIEISTSADITIGASTLTLKSGTGSSDTANVTFSGTGAITFIGALATDTGSGTNGIETLTINCTGGAVNFHADDQLGGANDLLRKVILTGSANVAVGNSVNDELADSSTLVELDASAMTGAITMTGTINNGTISVTIKSGSGNDRLLGDITADTLSGGAGNDTLIGGEGADNVTTGSGGDTVSLDNSATTTATIDTVTDFDAGTSSSTVDKIELDLSEAEGLTVATDLVDTSANSTVGNGALTYATLSSDGATVANADIVGLIGDYADAAAALAAKASWTIVYGATLADNDAFYVAYTSGSDVRIAIVVEIGANANSDTIDSVTDLLILQNVTLSNLNSGDFTVIKA